MMNLLHKNAYCMLKHIPKVNLQCLWFQLRMFYGSFQLFSIDRFDFGSVKLCICCAVPALLTETLESHVALQYLSCRGQYRNVCSVLFCAAK